MVDANQQVIVLSHATSPATRPGSGEPRLLPISTCALDSGRLIWVARRQFPMTPDSIRIVPVAPAPLSRMRSRPTGVSEVTTHAAAESGRDHSRHEKSTRIRRAPGVAIVVRKSQIHPSYFRNCTSPRRAISTYLGWSASAGTCIPLSPQCSWNLRHWSGASNRPTTT